ncbi:MAG: TonB-dependent receptor [Bacteroidota bacterium]
MKRRDGLSLIIWLGLIAWSSSFSSLQAQTRTGNIRGQVTSMTNFSPLEGVEVRLINTDPVLSTQTDARGQFEFIGIPVGRYDLMFSATGYEKAIRPGLLLNAFKELIVDLKLETTLYELDEVELSPIKEKGLPNNEMATVSALSFDVEETRKFAGGLDDPARLAANLPGVAPNPFISDNMISIRGNSPRGLIYRVEGIDIPNPTHFARIGSSGGSFSIFSLQVLDNSDFFVGAFPAEYGNATSGVFDIKFRTGNNRQREFALQAGVLGVDLAAEGPFKEGGEASYLVNYRFATFNLVNAVISYATLPTYQDLAFKLHLPTKNAGTFGIFGIGGMSQRLNPAVEDSALWEADLDRFRNVLASDMGALGITHKIAIGRKSLWQSALVASAAKLVDNKEYLDDELAFFQRDKNEYTRQPLTFTTSIRHSFSERHTNKTGLILTSTYHDYLSQKFDYVQDRLFTQADEAGRTQMVQAYSQSRFRLSPRLTANLGVHFLYYDLNEGMSIEPRVGIGYQLNARQHLSVGYGLHSRTEHFATYMTRFEEENGALSLPNQNLDFIRTHHFVLGYRHSISDRLKFRSEIYYQSLFNVPVEVNGTYSVLNIDELDELRVFDNSGTARNYGIDLGLEQYSQKGMYYMLNLSLFDSRYTDGQGQEHQTAFNYQYKANVLGGKEFKIGKKKGLNKRLGLNGTLTAIGGERYTPIDLIASREARETIRDESQPYTGQEKPLFIFDFTLTIQNNKEKYTGIWAIQLKNMFSNRVPEYREYDALLDQEVFQAGASILPVLSYKVEF